MQCESDTSDWVWIEFQIEDIVIDKGEIVAGGEEIIGEIEYESNGCLFVVEGLKDES